MSIKLRGIECVYEFTTGMVNTKKHPSSTMNVNTMTRLELAERLLGRSERKYMKRQYKDSLRDYFKVVEIIKTIDSKRIAPAIETVSAFGLALIATHKYLLNRIRRGY